MKKIEIKTFVQGVVLFAALCLCAGYIVSSPRARSAAQQQEEKKAPDSLSPEQLARTRALFNEKCARCHGEDGRGETQTGSMLGVPNFTDEKFWKEEKDDKRFVTSITNGKDGMPAFGKKLSEQEINALFAYVRRFPRAAR